MNKENKRLCRGSGLEYGSTTYVNFHDTNSVVKVTRIAQLPQVIDGVVFRSDADGVGGGKGNGAYISNNIKYEGPILKSIQHKKEQPFSVTEIEIEKAHI